MVQLPNGWSYAKIGNLCFLHNGRAFKQTEWSTEGLPIIRIQNLNNPKASFNHFNGALAEKHRIQTGDLLFAWSGTPGTSFGAHEWKGEEAALNQHIFKVDFNKELISKRFFRHAINHKLDELIGNANGGVGLRHITKGKFELTLVSMPPLPEQTRIVEKLDEVLAQVDTIKVRLDGIPNILKRFRQSVLASAVSGRLTEEWRNRNQSAPASLTLQKMHIAREKKLTKEIAADNKETKRLWGKIKKHSPKLPTSELPSGWLWTTFMSSMERVVDCHNKTAPYIDSGLPLIRTPDIRDGKISLDGAKYISQETYDYWARRCPPEEGDIIFTREAPMGEAGIVPEGVKLCMGQRMMLLRPMPDFIDSRYVLLNILSLDFQERMYSQAIGTGVKHLRVADVESLSYPLAPLEEQKEIVRLVDQYFAFADSIEAQVDKARARVDKLTQSLLAKAFRGELVPQDPNDEPADKLLERIQVARQEAEALAKAAKKAANAKKRAAKA